jgi:hypothetical protein
MSNISNIIANIPEADYPPLLVDALAFQAATAALVTAANDEKPVDLNTATTPKNLGGVYTAAVTFELGHDARVRHAAALLKIATERTAAAEQRTATLAEPWFAEQFDAAAKVLLDVIGKHDGGVDPAVTEHGGWPFDPQYAELRDALADVARWGNLRTDYVFRGGGGQLANVPVSNVYERHSRTAILADHNTDQLLEQAASRYRWLDAGYWLVAAQAPGVTICWQTSTQQHAQPAPAKIARYRAAMADQMKAREDARRSA